jgi:hypothetical protein
MQKTQPRFIVIHTLAAFFMACAAGNLYLLINIKHIRKTLHFDLSQLFEPNGFNFDLSESIHLLQLFVLLAYSPLLGILASLFLSLLLFIKKKLSWINYLFLVILSILTFGLFIGDPQKSIPLPKSFVEKNFEPESFIAFNINVYLFLALFLIFNRRINNYNSTKVN